MTKIRVRFMGKDDPLALRHGKVYNAVVGDKGWYGIVDETNEEYAYPPELFDVVEQKQTVVSVVKQWRVVRESVFSKNSKQLYSATCPACGGELQSAYWGEVESAVVVYCPKCGAKKQDDFAIEAPWFAEVASSRR